eukprot:TRINITY_DN15426_c0_g1_i1.p1 TRINITY_DN15426_c0_g1~~TRINITY_DN15426_c0_g1_i1.p1  ORF type:complete len:125 (+),score=12.09 TRINITY_DN15426_c0_g1_i1:91-465(+)
MRSRTPAPPADAGRQRSGSPSRRARSVSPELRRVVHGAQDLTRTEFKRLVRELCFRADKWKRPSTIKKPQVAHQALRKKDGKKLHEFMQMSEDWKRKINQVMAGVAGIREHFKQTKQLTQQIGS